MFGLSLDVGIGYMAGVGTGYEIVIDGEFNTGISGWIALSNGVLTHTNNRLRVANSGANYGKAAYQILTTVGADYILDIDTYNGTSSAAPQLRVGTTAGGSDLALMSGAVTGNHTLQFTATSSTSYVGCSPNTNVDTEYSEFDNVSVKSLSHGG